MGYVWLFGGRIQKNMLTSFKEVHDADSVASFYGDMSTKLLLVDGSWQILSAIDGAGTSELQVVPIPPTWHSISAAWATPCPANSCEEAWIAGWDGADVIVGSLKRVATNWAFRSRFKVWPEEGAWCKDMVHGPGVCRKGDGQYRHVRGLQIGMNGTTLAVLHGWEQSSPRGNISGSSIDGWDLLTGLPIGRWNLGANLYTTFCHDAQDLLLIRWTEQGPQLQSTPLPAVFNYVLGS